MRTQYKPVQALDKLDRRTLDLLQKDGRLSIKELSEVVGPTITPCIEHVRRLEREDFILGYCAWLNPAILGASLLVFVEISLGNKFGNMFEQFRHEVLRIPGVLEYHFMFDNFDYLTKACICEMGEYRRLLDDVPLQLPGAVQSKSYIVMEEARETLTIDVTEKSG